MARQKMEKSQHSVEKKENWNLKKKIQRNLSTKTQCMEESGQFGL